jgi:short-subunit dehydrogenase
MIPGLAKELRPYGVAVIGLMPGFVATERTAVELREYGFDPAQRAIRSRSRAATCAVRSFMPTTNRCGSTDTVLNEAP